MNKSKPSSVISFLFFALCEDVTFRNAVHEVKNSTMKMLDPVKVMVEKDEYAKEGVHKGMYGWICEDECIGGRWFVNFPQYGEKSDIATITIREEDMIQVPMMYAIVNEQIKAQFGD